MSRKYCAPMSGDWTTSARQGAENELLKLWTEPFGVKADSPMPRFLTSPSIE